MELWLAAPAPVDVSSDIHIAAGERVLMTISRKPTLDSLRNMTHRNGWHLQVGESHVVHAPCWHPDIDHCTGPILDCQAEEIRLKIELAV